MKQLIGRDRHDLSASNYLREARSILRQDEMRRPIAVELRMVAGAAQAYLLTGTPSAEGRGKDEADSSKPRSTVIASVVAPAQVRIESSRGQKPPPPSATRPKSAVATKRSALTQTLTSEG